MGWVPGARLGSGMANAGGLGILASATMSLEELERAILDVKARPTSRSGSTCAPTPATRATAATS